MKTVIRLIFSMLLIVLIGSCTNVYNKALKSKDNEFRLKAAEKFYVEKKWEKASILYESVFPAFRGTPRFEDIYFKYAMCAYNQKSYTIAEEFFKTYMENFASGPRAEEAEYLRAYSYYKQSPIVPLDQTSTQKAMGLMQTYLTSHPSSPRSKEAEAIIEEGRLKMERKEMESAELYYNLGYYKAAAIAFANIVDNYPDSQHGDEYKMQSVRSYFRYAQNSVEEKQVERYQKVLAECTDFAERYPDSKFAAQVQEYKVLTLANLQKINSNEQVKKAA